MSEISGWRRAFDALESLVHSDEFARMTAVIARNRRLTGNRVNAIAARVWHLMNLPAGTDMQRLRMQVGALDREVRRLSLQLDRAAISEPDERRRTRASRGDFLKQRSRVTT